MKTSDVFDELFAFLDTVSDETLKEEFASLEKFSTGVLVSDYFALMDSYSKNICESISVNFEDASYELNAYEDTVSLAA